MTLARCMLAVVLLVVAHSVCAAREAAARTLHAHGRAHGHARRQHHPGHPQPPPPPLVFVHIPKTGGTTLTEFFTQAMAHRGCQEEAFADEPPPGDAGAAAPCRWAHVRAAPDRDERSLLLKAAYGGARAVRLDYLVGHVPYGYCPILNSPRPGCVYTTVLRRPVERLLSHYFYLRAMHKGLLEEHCGPSCSLGKFVEAMEDGRLRALGFDNLQTRMLAGDGLWNSLTHAHVQDAEEQVDRAMLQRAKFNLAKDFALIGFTEEMWPYAQKLQALLGIDASVAIGVGHANETPLKPKTSRIKRDLLKRLARTQAYDIQLYAFARRLQALRAEGAQQGVRQAAQGAQERPRRRRHAGAAAPAAGVQYAHTRRQAGTAQAA